MIAFSGNFRHVEWPALLTGGMSDDLKLISEFRSMQFAMIKCAQLISFVISGFALKVLFGMH